MAKSKSNIFTNTLVLVIITLVAILALSVVNQITRGPIEEAELKARAEVYKSVYSDASGFKEVEDAQKLIDAAPELFKEYGLDGCSINDVLCAENAAGEAEGYVIAATSPSGYGGDVQIAIGIKDGKLTGFDVVSNSETAGLGSKCTDESFTSQFAGKNAALIEYTKTGAVEDNQIDAISGATITTNAVTQATNAAIVFYQANFGEGLDDTASASDDNGTDAVSGAIEDGLAEAQQDKTPDVQSGTTVENKGQHAGKGKGGKS